MGGSLRNDNLRPDGDHADEESEGGKGSGFLDNGPKHVDLPQLNPIEQAKNIVHVMF
jgi:hypothetical protein